MIVSFTGKALNDEADSTSILCGGSINIEISRSRGHITVRSGGHVFIQQIGKGLGFDGSL